MAEYNSLEWHNECIANWKKTLVNMEKELAQQMAEVERTRQDIAFYETQILQAAQQGKESFDREKFLKKYQRITPQPDKV